MVLTEIMGCMVVGWLGRHGEEVREDGQAAHHPTAKGEWAGGE